MARIILAPNSNNNRAIHLPNSCGFRLAFISSYIPRKCGIATFTKDLSDGINLLNPERLAEVIAMDNTISEELDYPWEVGHRIRSENWSDYEKVLEYLNNSVIDLVVIQHEFGIYGGKNGRFILDFVKKLKKPFIMTMHTVLNKPSEDQKQIVHSLVSLSRAAVVMLPAAQRILSEVYSIEEEKTVYIPHGAPDLPFEPANEAIKTKLGLAGKTVMSSINLIGYGRGLEYVIASLPDIVKKYPNFVYLVIGQTHPVVLKEEGEKYRRELERLVKKYHLENNVQFVNRYIALGELVDYIRASDLYITAYDNLEQITSGALAYAIAAGKVCISTPYLYAKQSLAGGRGYFIEPKSPESISSTILSALDHPGEMETIRQKCYLEGRKMIWARVGYSYLELASQIVKSAARRQYLSRPRLAYIERMTTDIGMIEHSHRNRHSKRDGYAVDDNSRALMVAVQHGSIPLAKCYLSFLESAVHDGYVYTDADIKGKWFGQPKAGDAYGRSIWGVSYALAYGTPYIQSKARKLLLKLWPRLEDVDSLRTQSYCLVGLCLIDGAMLGMDEEVVSATRDRLANCIMKAFDENAEDDWQWFDSRVTYGNSRMAHALLAYGRISGNARAMEIGLASLQFLLDKTFNSLDNCFNFIGCKEWFTKNGQKSKYDEQPIEAGTTTEALVEAYKSTGDHYYLAMAQKAMAWYHGDNANRRPLFNSVRQSVYDGLTPSGVNLNQGAEAVLSYHIGYFALASVLSECKQEVDYSHVKADQRQRPAVYRSAGN